jgi:hypothetical protein
MTEMERVRKWGVVDQFLKRLGLQPGQGGGIRFLDNPTDEIDHLIARTGGRLPKLYASGQAQAGGVVGRVEENYLYSTRRFPLNTANNTISSGAVAAQDYNFFSFGFGDVGTQAGYFSIASLGYLQTNMASGGAIPNGRAFRMFDLGVSFNAGAKAADIAQLLDVCNLRFDKQGGALVIQHGPLIYWPGGVGVSGFAANSTTASTTTINVQNASNGLAALSNVRRFKSPRVLNANEKFMYVVTALASTPNSQTAVALSDFVEMRVGLFGQVLDAIAQ